MLIAYLSAVFCVFTRAILSVIDRSIFKNSGNNFSSLVFCNAFFPFLCALTVTCLFNPDFKYLSTIIFNPGVILSGFAAQLAAICFSKGFQQMDVKAVVVASKATDLFIPLVLYVFGKNFSVHNYLFSLVTTMIFFPVFKNITSRAGVFKWKIAAQLLICLCFQAVVNHYFKVPDLAQTWGAFVSLVTLILFWRMILVVGTILVKKENIISVLKSLSSQICISLFFRANLAFVSQAAFFYSITRVDSYVAWPVLNAGPLLSCFAAHFLLRERLEKSEKQVVSYFSFVSFIYLLTTKMWLWI